jgi:transcriptional regulator with XRE-family HTH domain
MYGYMEASEIKPLRLRLGLTQQELATALDVDPMTISRWERGVQGVSRSLSRIIALSLGRLERKAARP